MDGVWILLFCVPTVNKKKWNEISELFEDASFKACLKPFVKLFSILDDVGSRSTAESSFCGKTGTGIIKNALLYYGYLI